MIRRSAIFVILLSFAVGEAAGNGGGVVEPMNEMHKSSKATVWFELGAGPGQLYYRANPVSDIVPTALAIGPEGEISIMENAVRRIQGFSPDGRLLSVLTLDTVQETLSTTSVIEMFVNVFATGPYKATALVRFKQPDSPARQYWLVSYRVDTGTIIGHQAMSMLPSGGDIVERSFLTKEGYLWLFSNKWYVFETLGQQVAELGKEGIYVDRNGMLYIGGDRVKLMARNGRVSATLAVDPKASVDIDGGDPETFLFSWDRNVEMKSTAEMDRFPNVLRLYRIDAKNQCLRLSTHTPVVPETKISTPYPHLDVLAYSKDKYWLERYDFSPWLRP
ncbi:MAG: hypothetical protein JRE23_14935 [Deltaproteobacteria bacterium]|nr:hypothetical protein [Deltaproteobacteria bacterium]